MKKTVLLLALFFTISTLAQQIGDDTLGSWHMYFGTNKVSEKLSIHTEAQLRYYENGKNFNQLLLRTGLNYHINENAIATFGYGYIATDPTFEDFRILGIDAEVADSNIIEHRIFEQFILKNTVGQFKFEHRYRLEQRFINDKDFSGKDTQHRARYRLQVTYPLSKVFFLNFYDEIFLNLQDAVYGQNRLYGAIGANVFKNTSVQIGYLKNHFPSANFDRLQIGVFYNPDLRKKVKE
ncbi:DUF2490 domain-containing protein [Maribacter algarum]|uniref:DUF2490 domain-containing protein n=1 Tax=Maribacter algarum (ex Zhang et al. 2020) TaxID=2578118 RepID=A0A5S3PQ99_9FLAO|nr:DUF2490 domain-containing protein [Maribacter algarum]TMM56882.1 DUF2490 domain-containing protein [Maribacter algarum]